MTTRNFWKKRLRKSCPESTISTDWRQLWLNGVSKSTKTSSWCKCKPWKRWANFKRIFRSSVIRSKSSKSQSGALAWTKTLVKSGSLLGKSTLQKKETVVCAQRNYAMLSKLERLHRHSESGGSAKRPPSRCESSSKRENSSSVCWTWSRASMLGGSKIALIEHSQTNWMLKLRTCEICVCSKPLIWSKGILRRSLAKVTSTRVKLKTR